MGTVTSTEAGRVVASNAQARRQQVATDARAKARAELAANGNGYNRATPPISAEQAEDDAAPLFTPNTLGEVKLATIPEPPAARQAPAATPARSIGLTTTITYRDYDITITATGYTLDQFCDMIDRCLGVVG
jgi:predicted component of type VI protein secretion system